MIPGILHDGDLTGCQDPASIATQEEGSTSLQNPIPDSIHLEKGTSRATISQGSNMTATIPQDPLRKKMAGVFWEIQADTYPSCHNPRKVCDWPQVYSFAEHQP